jgi:hypothetical protein
MNTKQVLRILLSITIVLYIMGGDINAQQPDNENYTPPLRERMIFGGNFSLQFGTYTYIDVSPIIGLWLLPRLSVAAGPSYKYIKDPQGPSNAFGGKAFARFAIIQDLNNLIPVGIRMSIYAHGEYEGMSYKSDFFYPTSETDRFYQDYLLLGFGISQYVGPRSSMNFSVLWVVNQTEIQVYDNPEIRIGFTF